MKTTRTWVIAGLIVAVGLAGQTAVRAQGDRAERPGVEEHFGRMGLGPEVVERIRGALTDAGLDERQADGALRGMLRLVHAMRKHGDDFEMGARVREHFVDRLGLSDEQLERVLGLARRVTAVVRERTGQRPGMFTEGPVALQVEIRVQGFDTNSNLTIEPQELEDGFLAMLEQFGVGRNILLQHADADGDGTLNEEERQVARRLVFALAAMLLCDENGDWHVDDPEADQAWAKLAEACQRHNDELLRRLDRDGDGVLSPEERAAQGGPQGRQ